MDPKCPHPDRQLCTLRLVANEERDIHVCLPCELVHGGRKLRREPADAIMKISADIAGIKEEPYATLGGLRRFVGGLVFADAVAANGILHSAPPLRRGVLSAVEPLERVERTVEVVRAHRFEGGQLHALVVLW